MTSLALAILCASLFAWRSLERRKHLAALDRVITEGRIALDFIRDEHAELPHEFAAVYLAGNRKAMDAKFPGFAEYRAMCLRELEDEGRTL